MARKTILAALLAALTALIVAAPAAAVPRSFYGIVPQINPTHDEFTRMGQGQVGSYRWPLSWRGIEHTKGVYTFGPTDNLMTELATNGIRPVPFVCCPPAFIHEDERKPPTGAAEEKAYTEWLTAVMKRYGRGGDFWAENPGLPENPITDVQIFNEPNSSSFYHPKPDPAEYAHLLEISSKAIHDVDPGAFIVLGGMFGTPHPADGKAIDAWKFLSKLYKKGARQFFDAAASHPYSGNLSGIKFQIKKFRKVMKRNHDGGADIWITEMGWGSKKHIASPLGKGKKGQSKILKKSFKLLKKKRNKWNIHGIMWFTFKDHDDPTFCTWCDSAGLFSKSLEAKPAWKQYVKFTGGTP